MGGFLSDDLLDNDDTQEEEDAANEEDVLDPFWQPTPFQPPVEANEARKSKKQASFAKSISLSSLKTGSALQHSATRPVSMSTLMEEGCSGTPSVAPNVIRDEKNASNSSVDASQSSLDSTSSHGRIYRHQRKRSKTSLSTGKIQWPPEWWTLHAASNTTAAAHVAALASTSTISQRSQKQQSGYWGFLKKKSSRRGRRSMSVRLYTAHLISNLAHLAFTIWWLAFQVSPFIF